MVRSVSLAKEIVVTVENKVGVMAGVSKVLAEHGMNIEGACGYEIGSEAKLMFVVTDTLRAKDALTRAGYNNVKEHEVVVVNLENRPGALKVITAKLSAGKINIKYMYGTTCPEGCPAGIILSTDSNEKALVALKAG